MSDPDIHHPRRHFLRAALRAGGVAAAALLAPRMVLAQGPVLVRGARVSADGGTTRIVLDLSGHVEHSLFTLNGPERVVVDLRLARLSGTLAAPLPADTALTGIRHGVRNDTDLRLVLDLAAKATPKSFMLPPGDGSGHRLVIDLEHGAAATGSKPPSPAPAPDRGPAAPAIPPREVVIAIDAGHGGRDPGAIGPGGTYEKDVVLAIARRLETLVRHETGMRAVLIRNGDHFLTLRERIRRARDAKADVFVSIHADAAPNRSAAGSSVYVLSPRGATSEHARWLAERENAADLVGGVKLDDKDDLLASVLLDLSQAATTEASMTLADSLIGELHRVGKVRSRKVEQAGFVVLKSPDIPSVLVETAYISNPGEERKLRSTAFQQSMAEALHNGLRSHFRRHAPPGTLLAEAPSGQHVIRNGETLSGIASQYNITLSDLRRHNKLNSDRIHTGQVLIIPQRDS